MALSVVLSANAAEPLMVDEKLVVSGKIDIRPDYPSEAQAQRLTGAGVFILHVHQSSGRVMSVQVERSTGHKILDDSAVARFSTLRFKPDSVARVKIPVEFVLPPPVEVIHGYPATALFRTEQQTMSQRGSMGGHSGK